MKRIALVLTLLLVACSSSDPYERPERPQRMNRRPMATGMDLFPPPGWWHDYTLAEPVNLSNEQMQQLDRVAADNGQEEIQKLERDTMTATRDLRAVLDTDRPSTDEIVTAGQRIRSLRDDISERQIKLLAAERQVLTLQQWQKLQDVLREDRMPRDRRNDGYGRRGRGGFGGRGPGRRPY